MVEHAAAEDLGIEPVALERALALALAGEPALPRDMRAWLTTTLADEPWPQIMGDVLDRGGPNGVVWVGGREVASWGDPDRVEMCFSLAKSALATVAGIAYADGLLTDLDRAVPAAGPAAREPGRGGHRRRRGRRPRDHLAPPADADERLARRAVRRPLVGRPAGPHGAERAAPRRRRALLLQRRPHQPLLARAHPPARRLARQDLQAARLRPDRRHLRLELARPRADAHRAARRSRRPGRDRRQPLGRRLVVQRPRPRPLGPAAPARRRARRPAGARPDVVRAAAREHRRAPGLRPDVVAQPPRRDRVPRLRRSRLRRPRHRRAARLVRPRARPRRRRALGA